MITEHAVNMALHHGLLLAGTDCVLLHGVEERAAEIAAGTYQTGAAVTNTALAVPPAPSAPTNVPPATGGVIETTARASSTQGGGASGDLLYIFRIALLLSFLESWEREVPPLGQIPVSQLPSIP